ncbi:MAG: FtsX-like permease family protein [Acidobacteriaceae bacterium]|nr:FtsX-like permease family protein [Acidobacteriaceae bacterium]MBV9499093.1 FtsX-like permease family protein [Acidobacteriaceae bacterium]
MTISSIAVSLCLLGVLIAMYHALFFSQETPGQALRLVVRHKVSLAQPLPVAYEDKVRRLPGVREISVWNWFGGTYKDNRDTKNFFARMGVEPKPFLRIRTQMEMPEDQRRAFITDRTGCVVSRDLAEKLNFHLGDRITLQGDIYPVNLDLKVVGIFYDPDALDTLFFNYDYLRDALPLGRRNFISVLAVLADSPDDVPRIAQAVDAMTRESSYPTKTESEQQFALSFVSFIGNIKLFLLSICAAVTFTILLVSGNTMAMSVRERIKEVGVLKTLGFNNDTILGIIIGEAITIALIGGIIGLLLASFLTIGVGKAAAAFMPQLNGLSITPITIVIALGVAILIGIVSSFVPAWNAARTNILDSLRYTG